MAVAGGAAAAFVAVVGCGGSGETETTLQTVWSEPLPSATGALVTAGLVLATDQWSALHARDGETGELRWMEPLGGVAVGAPVADDEQVHVVTEEGALAAFAFLTGELRWSLSLGGSVTAGLALAGGRLFVAETSGVLTALAAASGVPLWTVDLGSDVLVTPAANDVLLLVATIDGNLTRLDPATGDTQWQVAPDPTYVIGPPILDDELAVVPGYEDTVLGLSLADGATLWSRYGGNYLVALPATRDGTVYFGTAQGPVSALSLLDGELLWTAPRVLSGRQAILVPTTDHLLVVDKGGPITWLSPADGTTAGGADLGFEITAAIPMGPQMNAFVVAGADTIEKLELVVSAP